MYKQILLVLCVVAIIAGVGAFIFTTRQKTKMAQESETVTLQDGDTYEITASYVKKIIAGKEQTMLAYNGSIPGPTIRVQQGSRVSIVFTNNTDRMELLHSHGVRMENKYDGSQMVQKEIQPGESFTYQLVFPDAGVYWYHPHAGEVVGQALGLYGAFVVVPRDENYFPKVNSEQVVFLSDIPMIRGAVSINADSYALMGHYGNVMLTNGSDAYTLKAQKGEVKRLYIINSANARPYNFAIQGTKMKLIGGDSGAYERATFVDEVLLGPSERAIVDVLFSDSGTFAIENKTPNGTTNLGNIVVESQNTAISYTQEYNLLQAHARTTSSIEPFLSYIGKAPDKNIRLSIRSSRGMGASMTSAGDSGDGIEWEDTNMMNAMMTADMALWEIIDEQTGKVNNDIMWELPLNKPVVIRIFNDPNSMHPMQHPIHFHGQRFLVVARDGVLQNNLAWKDTALIKTGETVDVVLDPSNIGTWMAHCHISEHLAAGMMFGFKVK